MTPRSLTRPGHGTPPRMPLADHAITFTRPPTTTCCTEPAITQTAWNRYQLHTPRGDYHIRLERDHGHYRGDCHPPDGQSCPGPARGQACSHHWQIRAAAVHHHEDTRGRIVRIWERLEIELSPRITTRYPTTEL